MFNTIELVPEKSIILPASGKVDIDSEDDDDFGDLLGGVIKNGELGWIASGPHLDIYLMKNKQRISSYTFELNSNLQPSLISCIAELFIPEINSPILAVCVQFAESNGMICIFSVQGSRILRSLEFPDKITSCCFIPTLALKYSGIKIFDGCLAVGTDLGKVFLIDLCLKKYNDVLQDKMTFRNEIELVPVFNVLLDVGFDSIKSSVKKSRKENCHLSVQLQVLQDSGTVLSMLLLGQQMTLVIGLYDGRMILYDLNNLQAFHLAYPPEMESPLMKLSFVEPLDDPRACIYIWALHYNSKTSIAVMHSIMFEHKQFDPDGYVYFENFQACSARLTIPLFDQPNNRPINCQSIRNRATYEEEEEISCITIISWENLERNRINFFVFDLNQWYKDQMPEVLSTTKLPNYLALFAANGGKFGLDLWIYPKSIIPFNSVQRLEEHFYPNSLSFHCIVLSEKQCDHFHWTGVQNKAINYLNGLGSKGIVDPNVCFGMLTSTAIYPQNWEDMQESRLELTILVKRNFLLSIALEYNCLRLFKECIKLWGDGSHLGDGNDTGVSLSTITDWISQRSDQIIKYCKYLCSSFFNNIEQHIDYRLKKQLSYNSKQLKTLEKLLEMIVTVNRMYIPEEIKNRFGSEKETIKMWYEYFEIILWLSNTEILPEGATVPYPYDILNDYYKTQRYTFRKLDHTIRNYLFIDVFLDTKCNPKELRKLWHSTDGEYPPMSLKEMLNILILPNTSNEIKYILILYFFMDLSVALEEERFCNVIENLIKFPSVFKLNSSIIKRIQAYWKLDHGQHETALDYLFSPLSGEKSFETWETEFLIETLLLQDLPKLALRVLQLNNPSINSLLEIKTLLANNLISDAFKIQRIKNNVELLNYFYKFLFNNCKWELLLDYALNDNEIKVLTNFLNNINSNQSENFHIIFLLQRAKYIDAIKLLNKIKKLNSNTNLNMNNTNLILSAYNMTLTPAIKNLTKSYFNFENEFKLNKEVNGTIEQPFSKQLIENPVNSSFNLHKIVFNSIKNCRNGGRERPPSERIPFLENPYVNRSGNESQISDRMATIVPKVINSGDYGKRRSDPEPQDTIEYAQPKKKVMTEADYKIKTLKDFKQTRKYDFSQSYNKLMENKRNKMTTSDYTFLSKLSSQEEPPVNEEAEPENITSSSDAFKTTEDEFFSPEKPKISAEEWNSEIDMSFVDDRVSKEVVEQEPLVKHTKADPLIPEEKITSEIWNQGVVDHVPVEKPEEISSKIYNRPSKRPALYSKTRRTPERSFLRSRTKTPEPLTPRKSTRLIEKTMIVSSETVIETKISKITSDEFNSQINIPMEIDNQEIETLVEPQQVNVIKADTLIPEQKITSEMWNQESDHVVVDKVPEITHNIFVSSNQISVDKITPETGNQGLDQNTGEKSGEISRKSYDRPSKRRSLRSNSKTPERAFRRSRTKTPEPLTPRQSKRLLEKLPTVIPESVDEEKPEEKPLEIPSIIVEDFSSATTTVEVCHVIQTELVSEMDPAAKRQPVLNDTEKSEVLQVLDEESQQTSSDSLEIQPIKRAPVLKDDSDVSQIIEDSSNQSSELEITYHKNKLFDDSFVEDDVGFDDVEEQSSSSPSYESDDMPVDVDYNDDEGINYENDIEEVSEEEEIYEEQDDPDRYEVINILSSSSDENSIDFQEDSIRDSDEEDSSRGEDDENSNQIEDEEGGVQFVGENKTDDNKIISESQELTTEPDMENVSNIIYENMEIDERISGTVEDVASNNPIFFESENPEVSTQIQEVETSELIKPNDIANETMAPIIREPDDLEQTEQNSSNDKLNEAVIITELETITSDKTEANSTIVTEDASLLNQAMITDETFVESKSTLVVEHDDDAIISETLKLKANENINTMMIASSLEPENPSTTIISTFGEDASILNKGMIIDEIVEKNKSTFVVEPEDNAMTGDVLELKLNENQTPMVLEGTLARDEKDDSNTLNEALVMVDEEIGEALELKDTKIDKASNELTSKPVELPLSDPIEPENHNSPYLLRKTRGASVDLEISTTPKRSARGSSVPKTTINLDSDTVNLPMRRKRRSFSTDSHTPKKSIHITKADMEIIKEGEELPQVTTPIKSIIADRLRDTPKRRKSITIEQTGTPTTPVRVTRRSSITIEAEGTPIKLEDTATPTRARKRSNSIDTESVSSKVSESGSTKTRKTNKVSTPDSESHESPSDQIGSADYTSNRRLTRHQLALMEKVEGMRNTPPATLSTSEVETKSPTKVGKSRKRARPRAKQEADDNSAISDTESIASTGSSLASRASSLRSRGSRTSQRSSVKGKKEKKLSDSSPPVDKPLPTIDEDSENEESVSGHRLRDRTQPKK